MTGSSIFQGCTHKPREHEHAMIEDHKSNQTRRVFMILTPRALGYAHYALESLFRNASEPLQLHLITDTSDDRELLSEEIARHSIPRHILCRTLSKDDLRDREADVFFRYPNLRVFRSGHPCWRKIIDPILLTGPGEEMVVLDPDLYFPNHFTFEPTPDRGLLLMWQKPNCLLPPDVVHTAFAAKIPLADHVDIGVAHWRAPVDLSWLDWVIGKLGGRDLPGMMHIEAIVRAALAMRFGGGYLPTRYWHCWRRSQWKRVALKIGLPGLKLLKVEPFAKMKCFHAGGEAKWWLPDAASREWANPRQLLNERGDLLPFVELTQSDYERSQRTRRMLKLLGYYQIFQSA